MGERVFWKGKDFKTTEGVTIVKSAMVPIAMASGSFPPESVLGKNGAILLSSSIKSLRAQSGLTMVNVAPQLLLNKDKSETSVKVTNLALQPIHLPEGSGLFRLYYDSPELAVTGEELVSLVEAGRIKIDGEQGVDWQWSYKDRVNGINSIAGIYLRIKPEGREWIPSDPNNDDPIVIRDQVSTGVDYRKCLNPFLKPIRETDENILWIGETQKLTVGAGLEGILSRLAFHDIGRIGWRSIGLNSLSLLFDGGKTNWSARTEVFGPTTKDRISNFVHMRFARNSHQ